jgi:hypothetical protein
MITKKQLFEKYEIDKTHNIIKEDDYFNFGLIFSIVHLSPFKINELDSYYFLIEFLDGNPNNSPLLEELAESAKRFICVNHKGILKEINQIDNINEHFLL